MRAPQQFGQASFAFDQRQHPQITAPKPQQIEGNEVLRGTPSEQFIELRLSFSIEMNDLAIDNGFAGQRIRDTGRQCVEGFVDVPLPGDQFATFWCHVGERPKAIVFQLKEPIGMIERRVQARQRRAEAKAQRSIRGVPG